MNVDAAEMRILRAELLDAHRELVRLRTQTEQLMGSNRDLSGLLTSCAERMGDLLKVVVSFRRLLDSKDSSTAVRNLEDILVNVIGTEDFVILQVSEDPTLSVIGGRGEAVARARTARPTLRDIHASASARVVPMYIGERLAGAVVITSVLPQRDAIGARDDEVLSLISRFAASAVRMADEHKGWARLTPSQPS